MEEIDQNRGRGGIPQGDTQSIPEFKSTVKAETHTTPDYGTAFREQAATQNWMSAIGSEVAGKASNALAEKLGGEMGKTPHGDLLPPITNFDKELANSYKTQAASVLSLQATKLIDDSAIEIAKAPRLTPDLIAKANKSVMSGLQSITNNAPSEIKPQLEEQFGTQVLNNNVHLQNKMIAQNRQEDADTVSASTALYAQQITEFAIRGQTKEAQALIKKNQDMLSSASGRSAISKQGAQTAMLTASQNLINGTLINQAMTAIKEGRYDEFHAGIIKEKPDWIPQYSQWFQGINSIQSHFSQMIQEENKQNQIDLLKFKNAVIQNPLSVTGDQAIELAQGMNEKTQQEALHYYYVQRNKARKNGDDVTTIAANLDNPGIVGYASSDKLNKGFLLAAGDYSQKNNVPISEAKNLVAANAAAPIPGHVKEINDNLLSNNPDQIDAGVNSVDYMSMHNKGNNLSGLSEEALNRKLSYQNYLDQGYSPQDASILSKQAIAPKTREQKEAFMQVYKDFDNKKNGKTSQEFYLGQISLPLFGKDKIQNKPMLALQIQDVMRDDIMINGSTPDQARAKAQLRFNNTYGESNVNGKKQIVAHPLEDYYDLGDKSTGIIQHDIGTNLSVQLEKTKQDFDKGNTLWYYSLSPEHDIDLAKAASKRIIENQQKLNSNLITEKLLNAHDIKKRIDEDQKIVDSFNNPKKPLQIVKHWQDGHQEIYNVEMEASPYLGTSSDVKHPITGGWMVKLTDPKGNPAILNMTDSQSGNLVFFPNKDEAKNNYYELNPIMIDSGIQYIGNKPNLSDAAFKGANEKQLHKSMLEYTTRVQNELSKATTLSDEIAKTNFRPAFLRERQILGKGK